MVLVQILGANNQKFHLNISQLLLYGGTYQLWKLNRNLLGIIKYFWQYAQEIILHKCY